MAMADTVVVSAVKDILEKKSNAQCNEWEKDLKKEKKIVEEKIKSIKRGGEEWKIEANRHVVMKIKSLYYE
jgi:hypothetical protein